MRLRAFVVVGDRVERRDETVPWPATDADAAAFGRRLGATLIA
jgi:hypothetical protein